MKKILVALTGVLVLGLVSCTQEPQELTITKKDANYYFSNSYALNYSGTISYKYTNKDSYVEDKNGTLVKAGYSEEDYVNPSEGFFRMIESYDENGRKIEYKEIDLTKRYKLISKYYYDQDGAHYETDYVEDDKGNYFAEDKENNIYRAISSVNEILVKQGEKYLKVGYNEFPTFYKKVAKDELMSVPLKEGAPAQISWTNNEDPNKISNEKEYILDFGNTLDWSDYSKVKDFNDDFSITFYANGGTWQSPAVKIYKVGETYYFNEKDKAHKMEEFNPESNEFTLKIDYEINDNNNKKNNRIYSFDLKFTR